MKFGDYLIEWFEVYKKPRMTKRGSEPIETIIWLHIPQWLKSKEIADIKVFDIDKAISLLKPSRTQKYLFDTLRSALKKAYALDYIGKDISPLIEPIRYRMKSGNSLSSDELTLFFQAVKGHKLECLFYFYFFTGCRRSEALSLLWCDIDFSCKQVLLRGTKTVGSLRVVPMSVSLENLLKSIPKNGDRVFPYLADYVTKQFRKLCKTHSLKDLRHTFATVCAENGVHPTACQKMLGHTKIDTTLRIYTHIQGGFCMQELQKVDFSKGRLKIGQ